MLSDDARARLDPDMIYKVTKSTWRSEDPWAGSQDDLRDGFVHFSTYDQLPRTLEKFFGKCRDDLFLLAVDPACLAPADLRWESNGSSRVYPHLYAPMPHDAVMKIARLQWVGEDYDVQFIA